MSRLTRSPAGRRERSGWIGPLILILLGGVLFLSNAGVMNITRQIGGWLVVIPAAALLITAVPAALAGRWRGAVLRGFAGLVLAGVAAMLLFGIELGAWFPVLLVAAGLLLLAASLLGNKETA